MSGINVDFSIKNQKGTPAFFSDIFANRPAFGYPGRVFISTDTGQIFEDTGSAWTLLADAGVGGGTLSSVTANGNTTAFGIVVTANGVSTNNLTVQGSRASFFNGLATQLGITLQNGSVPGSLTPGDLWLYSATSGNNNIVFANSNYNSQFIFPTSNRVFTFPAATGTIALTTDLANYVTTDTVQTISQVKTFALGFGISSAGGGNQLTSFSNTSNLYSGSTALNIFGFNTTNNIYFSKGLTNGGILAWNNSVARTYNLPDADGTIALLSNLSSYLLLTGGTLTGALQVNGITTAIGYNTGTGSVTISNPFTPTTIISLASGSRLIQVYAYIPGSGGSSGTYQTISYMQNVNPLGATLNPFNGSGAGGLLFGTSGNNITIQTTFGGAPNIVYYKYIILD